MSHGKFSLKCLKKPKKGLGNFQALYILIYLQPLNKNLIKHIISINCITKEFGDFIQNH